MTALPIVERELRVASRRRRTYVTRSVVVGLMLILWLLIWANTNRTTTAAELARMLFWTYGIASVVYALLSGVLFTADALSVERREGTLGLLFLTDLRGYDVVLGKLVATSCHGVYALLALVPVLALPLLMGGVSYAEMARLIGLILAALMYSLAVGLLISTLTRKAMLAIALTFVVLLLQSGLSVLVAGLIDGFGGLDFDKNPLIWFCPFVSFVGLEDIAYARRGMMLHYWSPVVLMVTLGLVFLGLSCWLLPRVWRRGEQPRLKTQPASVPVTSSPEEAAASSEDVRAPSPGAAHRRVMNRWELDVNPYRWYALRERNVNRVLSAILGFLFVVWMILLSLSFERRMHDFGLGTAFIGAFVLHVLVKGWLAMESGRRFCDDRANGAMELLLATPLRASAIVNGELSAIRRTFRLPVSLIAIVSGLLFVVIVVFDPVNMRSDRWIFGEIILLGGIVLFFDIRALALTGMLAGLQSARHHWASLKSIARVLVPPWAGVILFMLLFARFLRREEDFRLWARVWFGLCIALDIFWMTYARAAMKKHFRALAAGCKLSEL